MLKEVKTKAEAICRAYWRFRKRVDVWLLRVEARSSAKQNAIWGE